MPEAMPANTPREVMDARDAAAYLGIGVKTLCGYAQAGALPALKLAGQWKFRRSRLNEWMDQQSRKGVERG